MIKPFFRILTSNIPAENPIHLAYGATVRSQCDTIIRTIVTVRQMHPENIAMRVNSHELFSSEL